MCCMECTSLLNGNKKHCFLRMTLPTKRCLVRQTELAGESHAHTVQCSQVCRSSGLVPIERTIQQCKGSSLALTVRPP